MKATRICSIDGCEKPTVGRGLCRPHYVKQWKSPRTCSIDGCDRAYKARGLCDTHYSRQRLNGDAGPALIHGFGKVPLDEPNYEASHNRVRRARGFASTHSCAHCGARAAEWAYDHNDPNELTGTARSGTRPTVTVKYSRDPSHYLPLCKPCHKKFDAHPKESR